jgi:hypothetical protein
MSHAAAELFRSWLTGWGLAVIEPNQLQRFMRGRLAWAVLAAAVLTGAALTAAFLKP